AGGAYVPLDPAYPQERLVFMLENAQAAVLLTQQNLLEKLGSYGTQVILLENDWSEIIQQQVHNPCSCVAANNLSYVIYTSGSTGKP
ncbi:MAG TPA: hypothetical protein DEV81_25470, partial [Cyanobacteria bacterium UBA11049]|nr:hypothetical protein [Cyanobacteria bacterium UBA11049]